MIRVVLLGAGKVAGHLLKSFTETPDIQVIQVYSRTPNQLELKYHSIPFTHDLSHLLEADVYVMAISDDAIAPLSKALPFEDRFVVHTSGSTALRAIHPKNRGGVLYPLQTFSQDKTVDFQQLPLCLEIDHDEDFTLLQSLAKLMGSQIHWFDSKQRLALHVAAVFVCNFVNHLYVHGSEICKHHGVPFEILQPLIMETAQKISSLTPQQAQTGPALRKDQNTLNKHLKLLEDTPHAHLYQLLTESIQNHVQKL